MTATEILDRFKELGVSIQLDGDKVRVAPRSLVPVDLMAEAKAHKAEIVQELQPAYGDGQTPALDRPPETREELARLIDHLADPGAFTQWLQWAMDYADPAEKVGCKRVCDGESSQGAKQT